MSHTILRLPQVKSRTGLSRSSIYLRMANGEFPESISLGGRAVGWLEHDVDEWIVTRIEESRINDHE
jgi:prophage regulatory protein